MKVGSLFLFFGYSAGAAAPGLPSSTAGCGAECLGSCFAGKCLYADVQLDDEDPFGTTQSRLAMAQLPKAAPGMAAYTAAWQGLAPQPTQEFRQALPPATANLDFQSVEPPRPLLQRHWEEPSAMAGLESMAGTAMENKATELTLELQRAEAHEAVLRAQNEQLRNQLEQWKITGANIAEREAKVVALLGAPAAQASTAAAATAPAAAAAVAATASAAPATASANATVEAAPSMLQQAVRRLRSTGESAYSYVNPSYLHPLFMTVGLLFMVMSGWKFGCFVLKMRKGDVGWKETLVSKATNPRLQPMLRAMGLSQFKVEVSEIHLGSLFAGSADIRVNFRLGNGTERRTKVLKNSGSTFLRFDDKLELSVCSSDAPCIICVTDKRGDLASVELPASELVRLATRPHQEYFRTELTASPGLGDVSDRLPYVAMRMRNIIATNARIKGEAMAGERAYGSFVV